MTTVNLFHGIFSKSRLCIPKRRKQATQAKGLSVFQHAAPFLPMFLLSCLLNSRSAPTSWYRSLFTGQVKGYKVSIPVVQCLLCCCWDVMCFSRWEAAVLLFHPSKAYGTTPCNREESWWVNDESLSLRQQSVLSKEKKNPKSVEEQSLTISGFVVICLQSLLYHVVCWMRSLFWHLLWQCKASLCTHASVVFLGYVISYGCT